MLDFLSALFRSLAPLWEMSVTAAYVSAVIIVLRLVLKKRAPKQILCLLWLVVFARLLIPVSLESPLSIVPDALPGQEQQIYLSNQPSGVGHPVIPVQSNSPAQGITPNQSANGTVTPVTNNTPTAPSLTVPEGVTPAVPQPEAPASFPWQAAVAGVWLAGAAAMGLYALISYLRLRRRLFDATRAEDGAWEHPAVDSPFILGVLRPRIYLPIGLVGRPRKFILCHERAHLRRLDHIVKPVCWLALALHWFNPLVWAAFILMSRDIESACDEAVVRRLGSEVKADYSTTLLALATGRRVPSPCPLAFDEGDAKGRIKNVLGYRRPALWVIVVSAVAVVLAAICLLTDPVAAKGPEGDPDPDASTSQEPENLTGTLLDPWMKEVLDGERLFCRPYGDRDYFSIHQLRTMVYGDEELPKVTVEVGKLAVIDLDRDGINEMVVWPTGESADSTEIGYYTGYFIFRRQGDTVHAYYPGWRSIGDLKADGTFEWSGSAFEWGTGSVWFDEGMLEVKQITWRSGMETENYFVNGLSATQEEFEAAIAAQNAKPEPTWYTYADGVLAPWLPDNLELISQTDPVSDTGAAKLWLEGGETPWLEWNGSTSRLNGLVTPDKFLYMLCRDFDGDGENEIVIAWQVNGFAQLDLYEWNGSQAVLAAPYDTQQLLVRFNQNNVAAYNKDTRKLTVTYGHMSGDNIYPDSDFDRHYVSGSCILPERFFDGFEHIRDSYTYAYAYDFRWFSPNTLANGTTEFYFDLAFCLADETMQDLDYVDVPPESELSPFSEYYVDHHYMADRFVGVAHFDLRYDGTGWRVREGDRLVMDYQDEAGQTTSVGDIYTAAPLDAPLVGQGQNIPDDPNQWYKVAELPDDMIWMFSRNYGEETLIRWDGNFFQLFDHTVHTPWHVMPNIKKLGSPDTYGPLAVISNVGSGTGVSAYELVVYDLDAAPVAVDYTHDWKPLMDDFNSNVTYRYGSDTHTLIYAYQGKMVEAVIEADDSTYRRIEQEGITLRVTGNHIDYWFDRVNDGDIKIELTIEAFVGNDVMCIIVPGGVEWTLRFNGSGFDTVPGSCKLTYPGFSYQ